MPIKACTLPGGGSGFQWGDSGHCYPTREQAEKQAAAAHANGFVGDEFEESKHPRKDNGEFGSGEPVAVNQPKRAPFVQDFLDAYTSISKQEAHVKTVSTEKLKKGIELIDKSKEESAGSQHVRKLLQAELHARGHAQDIALDATARTYDKDGRLHINRSHISKACVNPYYGREIPGADALGLNPDKIYYLLRSPDELAKAAPSFARLPILKEHVPVSAEAPRQDLIVGSIGSEVEFLEPYLDADVCIWDAAAIAGIETDKVREFSCAYHYVPIMSPGNYYGEPFDGIMTQIQGNHLALVESGRAGSDVLAADSKLTGEPMKRTKFGKAVMTTLTVAFPKVKIAQDSELDKLIAGSTPKTLDKVKVKTLVLAMDAEIPEQQVAIVMDALSDMDKDEPEPKKPAQDDDETEEERKKREKKEAEDKAAKDAEERDKDTKAAMDSFKKELKEANEARRDVQAVVGDVIAQDSAAEIYGFALDHLKVDHTGVEGVPALRALFKVASAKNATPAPVAMDAATAEKTFPGLARIRKA